MAALPIPINRFESRALAPRRRAPMHLGVTEEQREAFRQLLLTRLHSHLRSGRLTRFLVDRYRADLRSSNLPGWVVGDVRCVLDRMTEVLESPSYQEESSLSGDFADLAGILDWAKEGIESVWGSARETGTEIAERILSEPETAEPPVYTIPSADIEPARPPLPVVQLIEKAKGIPTWVWLAAGAACLFLRKRK